MLKAGPDTTTGATIAAVWFAATIQLVWCALLLDYSLKASLLIARFRGERWRHIEV